MEELKLEKLEVYRLGRELSRSAWGVYELFDWHTKKIIGDQFITAVDSYSANVAEAHGRFHYLDRAKFLFNARGSLYEALHWLDLLSERHLIQENVFQMCRKIILDIAPKLNSFIAYQFEQSKVNRNTNH